MNLNKKGNRRGMNPKSHGARPKSHPWKQPYFLDEHKQIRRAQLSGYKHGTTN
jgi:hypothetical protein